MNITNVIDYDNITDSDNMTLCNCTNNDNTNTNIEIVLPLITIIPCAMSPICLISLMVYTILKPSFIRKKNFVKYKWRSFFIQIILLEL